MKTYKQYLPMHLQFFAEPDDLSDEDKGAEPEGGQDTIEFDEQQQSEVDRRISKAVDNALKKHNEKTQKLIDAEVKKAQKKAEEYSKLSAQEKAEKDLEEREKRIAEQEQVLNTMQLKTEVEKDLLDLGLPTSLAEVLVKAEDNETIKTIITDIKKTVDATVNEGIKVGLRQDAPRDNVNMNGFAKKKNNLAEFAEKNRIIKN